MGMGESVNHAPPPHSLCETASTSGQASPVSLVLLMLRQPQGPSGMGLNTWMQQDHPHVYRFMHVA